MLGIRTRALTGIALVTSVMGLSLTAHAQYGVPCAPCAQAQATVAYAPSYYQTASINPCNPCAQAVAIQAPVAMVPCMQPVQETVYQDVQQVEYRPVAKTVKQPKVITVMEERDVVKYNQVMESRTVDVPSYTTQTYTECKAVTQNNSYWQSMRVPVQKPSPCQYDQRTGFLGEMNRLTLSMRNSLTPNYTTRRQFVPNVTAYNVPVQRTVQIPTTRQVTYNVARMVPETVKTKVAVQKTIWEDTEVTAYEPYTTTKRVAVGVQTRMVYADPSGGSSATAAQPTPATTAENPNKGTVKSLSSPQEQVPVRQPVYQNEVQQPQPQPQPVPVQDGFYSRGPVARTNTPSVIRVAGWKATSPERAKPLAAEGPELSIVAK